MNCSFKKSQSCIFQTSLIFQATVPDDDVTVLTCRVLKPCRFPINTKQGSVWEHLIYVTLRWQLVVKLSHRVRNQCPRDQTDHYSSEAGYQTCSGDFRPTWRRLSQLSLVSYLHPRVFLSRCDSVRHLHRLIPEKYVKHVRSQSAAGNKKSECLIMTLIQTHTAHIYFIFLTIRGFWSEGKIKCGSRNKKETSQT